MINILPILLLAIQAIPVPRLAICHDGNFHDPDDIGASGMDLGLVSRAQELQPGRFRLVYYGHSEHIGENDNSQHNDMIISATANLGGFNINPLVVFDNVLEHDAAARHLGRSIASSNPQDVLTIIQGGPWEKMARAYDAAPPETHQDTEIISHSDWNNNHLSESYHRNKDKFFAQYEQGGIYDGYLPPGYTRIDDQNFFAFRTWGLPSWNWLNGSSNGAFIYSRTAASGVAGDMSDAGMVFYWLTGIEHPTMGHIRSFFNL